MDIPSWCVKGQKVACIKDDWFPVDGKADNKTTHPKIKEIYTINKVSVFSNTVYLVFKECFPYDEYTYDCFKPVVSKTQEQDVGIFAPLLDIKKQKEVEKV